MADENLDLQDLYNDLDAPESSEPFPFQLRNSTSFVLAEKIRWDWKRLHDIIQRHEALIRRRWMKRPVQKRKEMLLNISATLPQHHRDAFDGMFSTPPAFEQRAGLSDEERLRSLVEYICPYMNLEDLSGRKHLPIFLNSRGRYRPDSFVVSETQFIVQEIKIRKPRTPKNHYC
jgi:hypothetical protein